MKSDFFEYARFVEYLKCYVGENRRSLIISGIVLLALPTFLVIVFTWMSIDSYSNLYTYNEMYPSALRDPCLWIVSCVLICCALLFGAVAGSKMFSVVSGRHSRVNFLMTPASAFEKYAALFLIYIVGFVVLMFCSANIANIMRLVVFGVDTEVYKYMEGLSLSQILMLDTKDVSITAMLWGLVLMVPAIYTLGGCLWPRHGFLMTTAFCVVANVLLTALASIPIVSMTLIDGDIEPRYEFFSESDNGLYLVAAGEFIIMIFCYIVSYFRLKEWEVVARW